VVKLTSPRILHSWQQQGFIVLLISCLPLSILFVNMEHIFLLFKQNPQICERDGKYSLGLLPSLFANAILNPLARFLQMQSIVWPEVYFSTIAIAFHLLWPDIFSCTIVIAFHLLACWVTIYKLGWGFIGASVCTSVIFWVNVGILVLYIKFSGIYKNTWLGFSKNCIHGIKHFLKLSIPSYVMVWYNLLLHPNHNLYLRNKMIVHVSKSDDKLQWNTIFELYLIYSTMLIGFTCHNFRTNRQDTPQLHIMFSNLDLLSSWVEIHL
jgi:hypothetical protein